MSIVDKIFGAPLASSEEEDQKVGVFAGIPMLGLDALSSAAYGPEAALTILLPIGAVGLNYIGPIIGALVLLLVLLFLSYRQTIASYPGGGGSYTVASENLGHRVGLLAGAALMLDYVLNVAVGISAGVGALVSAVPALHSHILALCLVILALITLVNLRGTRESGVAFALPTYLFVATLILVIIVGVARVLLSGGHPHPVITPPALPKAIVPVSLWLLLRAFASGCTAMTGVEAVSNGVSAFKAPSVKHAQNTLGAIVLILGVLLAGIGYLAHAYGIGATDPDSPAYQSVLSLLIAAVFGRGAFYYVTIGGILAVLCLSANTSFADFPRLCKLIAQDHYLPHSFANRGRRLVYSMGIIILALFSAAILTIFGGITDRLIPLFAIGALLAFTLSQAGMVVHWKRLGGIKSALPAFVNGLGAVATGVAVSIVLVAKFVDGAWITALLIPAGVLLFAAVKRHYEYVARDLVCTRSIDLGQLKPPIVVVPIKSWTTITEKALRFALQLSQDIKAVHIATDEADTNLIRSQWNTYVEGPIRNAGLAPPELTVVASPYRRLFNPLLDYIDTLKAEYPDRTIAVIIPELVESRWYQYPLHNQRATGLKAALLLKGGNQVVVINVPWYVTTHQAGGAIGVNHDG